MHPSFDNLRTKIQELEKGKTFDKSLPSKLSQKLLVTAIKNFSEYLPSKNDFVSRKSVSRFGEEAVKQTDFNQTNFKRMGKY